MLQSIMRILCIGTAIVGAVPAHAQTKALKELGIDLFGRWLEKEMGLAPRQAPGGSVPQQQYQQYGYQASAPTYEFLVQFLAGGVAHEGVLVMQGDTGLFRVQTMNGTFDQTMALQPYGNDVLLVGSNPRVAGSGIPAGNVYQPDIFRIVQTSPGQWAFADVCSHMGCSPVRVVGGRTR
jgi:hypothetical protein